MFQSCQEMFQHVVFQIPHSDDFFVMYSGANSCCNKALFIKQKCQIQMGVGQYKNAATPLRTKGIYTTHQHFQMR